MNYLNELMCMFITRYGYLLTKS